MLALDDPLLEDDADTVAPAAEALAEDALVAEAPPTRGTTPNCSRTRFSISIAIAGCSRK